MVIAIQTNRHSARLAACPRCDGAMREIDNEEVCFICGHRRYDAVTSQEQSDAARLLPSPEELAAMVEQSKRKSTVKVCKKCGVAMSTRGAFLCEECKVASRITFDCPVCDTPKTMLKSRHDFYASRNISGLVYCSPPCANKRRHRANQKTFLCACCRKPKTMPLRSYFDQKSRLKKAEGLCCSTRCAQNLRAL